MHVNMEYTNNLFVFIYFLCPFPSPSFPLNQNGDMLPIPSYFLSIQTDSIQDFKLFYLANEKPACAWSRFAEYKLANFKL